MRQMNCEPTRERLSEYLDEALGGRELRRVASHLDACADCRRELDDLRVTKIALQQAPMPAPDPRFWARVHTEVRRQSATIPAPRVGYGEWLSNLLRVWTPRKAIATSMAVAVVLAGTVSIRAHFASEDDSDELIAQHVQQSVAYPMIDRARLTFVGSEMNASKAEPLL